MNVGVVVRVNECVGVVHVNECVGSNHLAAVIIVSS